MFLYTACLLPSWRINFIIKQLQQKNYKIAPNFMHDFVADNKTIY